MFGKLFASMYDGSLHGHWKATVTLQQLVILSNRHGEVDMTAAAIAARTGIPLTILSEGIAELEKPDPESRGQAEEGRRIARLSPDRSWGWRIVNYLFYRSLANAEDKREGARVRQARHRNSSVTDGHALSRSSHHADAEAKAKADHQDPAARFTVRPATSADDRLEFAGPPFVPLPLRDARVALLSAEHIAVLEASFPTVRVADQLRSMRSWLVSNPGKRKTPRGILRFVDGWLRGEAEALAKIERSSTRSRSSDAAYAAELERGGRR